MTDPVHPQRENVVPLNPERRQAPAGVSLARLPAAMHSVRDKARQQLQSLLRELFDRADDSLFELADQATSNQEQNLYFDSMREVRLQRRGIEQRFFHRLDQGFAGLLDPNAAPKRREPDDEVSLDELTLVQNDELEQLVATEGMVNKANEQFAEPLQHLTLRMDQLVPVKVYQKNNPVGADAICTSFTESADALKIDVKAKLVLFKLFDKWVVSELGKLYQALNQQLIDANILPSLKAGAPVGKARRSASAQRASQERASRDEEANQVLHTLRDLLSSRQEGHAEGEGSSASTGGSSGEELNTQDLVQLLSQAQQRDWGATQPGSNPVNVQQLLRGLVEDNRRQSLNQVDEDVINLVSMMFEFILDDRNLASPMKAMLGRLQIPLVKVAIADKTFFSKGGHPARRLLNELAMAALGWQDTGEEGRRKDTLYQKMEQIVQTLLSEFESDVGIFDQMLLEFRTYQEKERRRAKILEQRTLDAEDGKARAERARAEVDAALMQLTRGKALEPAAQQLLQDAWAKVLFIICLKQGTESDDWADALETAKRLVWSATAPMDRDNRQKLLKLVPELLPRLRSGLESIAYNPYDMTQLFKQLEKLHLARLRVAAKPAPSETKQAPEAPVRREAERPPTPSSRTVEEPSPEKTVASEAEPVFQVVDEPTTESASGGKSSPEPQTGPETSAPAIEASALSQAQPPQDEPLSPSDPHLALVANLTQGSWFEMQDSQGQTYRCRLAAMIKPTGKYIFVNRSGMKVAEETREGLALALKSGRLRILDDGMLFDRALEAVIGNLRSTRAR
ncbi:DUF1631 domain-containing protein [Marinimicrobium agarilyticum]|uniref:DUF1631 domain-containing protein n=1 Tax=Marinimicrobium agarilyticum TaxID=306546 RepID=UPI000413D195|nr:DUF1631 domain-containing protein [Marinimicrobium agarilyticum]